MATGKKPSIGCGAYVKRIEKLTAELKAVRKNLRDAVKKAARDAKSWQNKLTAQVKRYEAKLKKTALHKALVTTEAKFGKALVKKAQKKPKKKAAPKKKVVKKAKPKKAAPKRAKPKKAAAKKTKK